MKKSLQRIEDFYLSRGHTGDALRRMLLKDKDYQQLLKEKKQKLTKKISLTKTEEKKYVMAVDDDYEILSKVKQLEALTLNKEEKFVVRFVRTQLERDWRQWLLKELDKMLLKHKPPSRG